MSRVLSGPQNRVSTKIPQVQKLLKQNSRRIRRGALLQPNGGALGAPPGLRGIARPSTSLMNRAP